MNQITKERVDLARAAWHRLVLDVVAVERELRGLGHPDEANVLSGYVNTLSMLGAQHCERIEGANGHNKDSHPDAGMQPVENAPAMGDEEVASDIAGHGQLVAAPPSATTHPDVTGGAPTLVERIEERIVEVREVIGRKRGSAEQRYECGLSFLTRALDLARRGHPTAEERFEAAENVLATGGV